MESIVSTYNYYLVALSIFIAILASYITFDLIGITWNEKGKGNYQKWLVVSASVIGVGIWTMHFVGMFSYRLPIPVHYEVIHTAMSLFMAILGSYAAFLIILNRQNLLHQYLGSIVMGAGIAGMHYTGMEGMHLPADMHYDISLVLLSLLVAVFVSWMALRLFIILHLEKVSVSLQKRLVIACVMGLAISGMHYIGMAAIIFTPNDRSLMLMHGVMIEGDAVLAAIVFSSVLLILTSIFIAKLKLGLTALLSQELGLIRMSEQQLRSMIENAPDGFFIHDTQGRFLDVNKAAYTNLGYTRDEILSAKVFDIEIGADPEGLKNKVWPYLNHGENILIHGTHKRKDGSTYPVDINLTCIKENDKSLIFALARDMTETEQLKEYLQKLSMTDELTNIYNRRAFMEGLDKEMSKAQRKDNDLSLLMIDIDHFKKINDMHGHDVGDLALKHFVNEAKKSFRKEDLIGRIGGEEFSILLADTNLDEAYRLAERFRNAIENSFIEVNNYKIQYTISIGVASFTDKNIAPNMLIKNADTALYKAKESGRNHVEIFNS